MQMMKRPTMIGRLPSSPPRTFSTQRRAGGPRRAPGGGARGWRSCRHLFLAGHDRQLAGGDRLDDLALRRLLDVEPRDVLTEAQHRDAVGDLEDVVQVVRDD